MSTLADAMPNGKAQWFASIIASIAMAVAGFSVAQLFDISGQAAVNAAQISTLQELVRSNQSAVIEVNITLRGLERQIARLNALLEQRQGN